MKYIAIEIWTGDDCGGANFYDLESTNMMSALAEAAAHERAYYTNQIHVFAYETRSEVDLVTIRAERAREEKAKRDAAQSTWELAERDRLIAKWGLPEEKSK